MSKDHEKIALERIEQAHRSNAKELVLSFLKLRTLPKEIGKLTKLEKLYCGGCGLEYLPPEIGNLIRTFA
jgi:Leucine-rich repeat (LRR) protein